MRFHRRPQPQLGDRRVRRGLVICRTIGNETRCLEFTKWTEQWEDRARLLYLPGWVPVAWGDARKVGA